MDLLTLQREPSAFRAALLIDTDAGPRSLAKCLDDWQRTDFEALDSGWQRVALGNKAPAKYQRAWLERGRGHSKTNDIAVMAAWVLFASRRMLSGIAAAGDQDQARLLHSAMSKLCSLNPWLNKVLEVQNNRIINTRTESTLDIITSDAKTSYGLTPDFIICDEVTHWKKRDLWDSLFSSAAKRAACMLVVICNAGLQDDWQWQTREAIRTSPDWYFSRLNGPVASWISPALLREQARILPAIAYRRLWLNEWTTGGGDALSPEVIAAAFLPDLRKQTRAQHGFEYVAGVDIGVTRDASAIVVLGVHRGPTDHARIRLASTELWLPTQTKKVDLTEVENKIIELHSRFNLVAINYDPYQCAHIAQRLMAIGLGVNVNQLSRYNLTSRIPMRELPQIGSNLQKIASCIIEAFNDYRVELYPDGDLRRDLEHLRVEERTYGFRLTSPHDEYGHGDTASAFGFAMLAAAELAGKRQIRIGPVDSLEPNTTALSRALSRSTRNAERHAVEMQRLEAGGSDPYGQEEWIRIMKRVGRR